MIPKSCRMLQRIMDSSKAQAAITATPPLEGSQRLDILSVLFSVDNKNA